MKLSLEEILLHIDDFARDSSRDKYPIDRRLRDINTKYFSVLGEIDRLKGVEVTGTQGDNNTNDISFAINDTIKPLTVTTDISYVTMTYDGADYTLKRIFGDDTDTVAIKREDDAGKPTHYILRDDSIEIFPKTNKAVTVHVSQSTRPVKFVEADPATQFSRLHEDLDMYLVYGVMEIYFTKGDIRIPKLITKELFLLDQKKKELYSPNRTFSIKYKKSKRIT